MRFAISVSIGLIFSGFANAGGTHGWCESKELTNVRVCEDQTGNYLKIGENSLVNLKFTAHGTDRSIAYYKAASSDFMLITTDWGLNRFLLDSVGNQHQLQCGDHSFGLCPRRPIK